MSYSIIKDCDSYKHSHKNFYPLNITEMYSYLESRGGKYENILFFGLEPILRKLSKCVKLKDVNEFKAFAKKHGIPFNEAGWLYIVNKLNGRLPLEIKAIKEGTLVPYHNVLISMCNTLPEFAWLTSFIETMILRIWYPITVATRIYEMKNKIIPYYKSTCDTMDGLNFAILDFSSRGCSSLETSKIGGSAYLINFLGSDNIPAVDYTNKHYNSDMSGFSLPATEHSIMCSYGHENEFSSFERIIDKTPYGETVSVVSDTWDIYNACELWNKLADKIKDKNITLVVRPDSGEIEEVLPRVIEILSKGFGSTKNLKGFSVLNNVKILWGDGINEDTCHLPFEIAKNLNISADSILTGSGGGLMQVDINRDTNKFAIKGSNVIVDEKSFGIAKNPITDPGKQSKMGKFKLVIVDGEYKTVDLYDPAYDGLENELKTVFCDGFLIGYDNLDEIRKRVENNRLV